MQSIALSTVAASVLLVTALMYARSGRLFGAIVLVFLSLVLMNYKG